MQEQVHSSITARAPHEISGDAQVIVTSTTPDLESRERFDRLAAATETGQASLQQELGGAAVAFTRNTLPVEEQRLLLPHEDSIDAQELVRRQLNRNVWAEHNRHHRRQQGYRGRHVWVPFPPSS